MIIRQDILQDLGFDLRFSSSTVKWDGSEIPMKDEDCTLENSYYLQDSKSVNDMTEHLHSILDAKYEAANLNKVVKSAEHLSEEEQQKLLTLLQKHESLFDGTLGQWKDSTYNIDLKEDAKPYHARAYPIPRVHMNTLKMEVERLCKIGVLK